MIRGDGSQRAAAARRGTWGMPETIRATGGGCVLVRGEADCWRCRNVSCSQPTRGCAARRNRRACTDRLDPRHSQHRSRSEVVTLTLYARPAAVRGGRSDHAGAHALRAPLAPKRRLRDEIVTLQAESRPRQGAAAVGAAGAGRLGGGGRRARHPRRHRAGRRRVAAASRAGVRRLARAGQGAAPWSTRSKRCAPTAKASPWR